jgi:hypothetical protein
MKTISEIQNEIKDMGIKLSELLNELEELKPKDNINKQVDFSKISRLAEQYPIENHKLKEADNYKKKLYLCMLSAIAQTNNDNREEKLIFLQRILLGIKYEGSFETIVKDGMNISDKILDEFVECMTDNDSKQLFIFESLIISNLGGEMDDIAKKYISEISGYIGVTKEEMNFLIKLTVSVLEQDINKYEKLVNIIPKTVDIFTFFNSYLKKFVYGVISNTKLMYYAYGIDADAEMINLISDKDLEGRKVIFENVNFDLKTINSDLKLKQSSRAYFINCNFKSEDKDIEFENVDNVIFYNCKFEEFSKRVCLFNDECGDIKIEKCTFQRCGYVMKSYESENKGGCFYVYGSNSFMLKDNKFSDCYIRNKEQNDTYAAIAYIKQVNNFEVNNINFINCHCYWSYSYSVASYKANLFDIPYDFKNNQYFINCKTVNSERLY